MIISVLNEKPDAQLCTMMQNFEARFNYPLGETARFSISHGEDYTLFFRSHGETAVFVASDGERVLGSVAACVRKLRRPDGSEISVAYLGDLKIVPDANRVLLKLLVSLQDWCMPRVEGAIAVVMNGTVITPDRYSGRLGLYEFTKCGGMTIIQMSASRTTCFETSIISRRFALELIEKLGPQQSFSLCSNSDSSCSSMQPIYIASNNGKAVACIEDTRMGKRLFTDHGEEMFNCHLTNFHFSSTEEAVTLLNKARSIAADKGLGGIFLSLDDQRKAALDPFLKRSDCVHANATIYGTSSINATALSSWYIHSSEV